MSTVIKVENISKLYRLGEIGTGALAHDVNRWWYKMRGKENPYLKIGESNDRSAKAGSEYVWALKDINFDVQQGEVLGIIGRNGAGKSTLLKILSRTTSPTTGKIKIKGRIASLLEVGTGFHPELSGRDNIFLNGAILGMTKREIKSKFDEIVDFAGVERYIDTPVKRYSSGMYVRLAFGVAAHLEPEILIVDEVLAVGDAEFQKKALGKMKDVSEKDGRTVLFVSHNIAAMQNLCTKGLLLTNGILSENGIIKDIVGSYLRKNSDHESISLVNRKDRTGTGDFIFTSVEMKNDKNENISLLQTGGDFKMNIYFKKKAAVTGELMIGIGINDQLGERISHLNNKMADINFKDFNIETGLVQISFSHLPLTNGRYTISLFASIDGNISDWINDAFSFNIESGDFYNTGNLLPEGQGSFLLDHTWSISSIN